MLKCRCAHAAAKLAYSVVEAAQTADIFLIGVETVDGCIVSCVFCLLLKSSDALAQAVGARGAEQRSLKLTVFDASPSALYALVRGMAFFFTYAELVLELCYLIRAFLGAASLKHQLVVLALQRRDKTASAVLVAQYRSCGIEARKRLGYVNALVGREHYILNRAAEILAVYAVSAYLTDIRGGAHDGSADTEYSLSRAARQTQLGIGLAVENSYAVAAAMDVFAFDAYQMRQRSGDSCSLVVAQLRKQRACGSSCLERRKMLCIRAGDNAVEHKKYKVGKRRFSGFVRTADYVYTVRERKCAAAQPLKGIYVQFSDDHIQVILL